jgi:hypothetical protein
MYKKGAIHWTVGKLVATVLILVVMLTMIWGFSNASHPAVQVMVGQLDKVILAMGFGDSDEENYSDCEVYNVSKRIGGASLQEIYRLTGEGDPDLVLRVCKSTNICSLIDPIGKRAFWFSDYEGELLLRMTLPGSGQVFPVNMDEILRGSAENAYFYWELYREGKEVLLEKRAEWENLPYAKDTDYIKFFGDDKDPKNAYAIWNAKVTEDGSLIQKWIVYETDLSSKTEFKRDYDAINYFTGMLEDSGWFDGHDEVYYSISSNDKFPKNPEDFWESLENFFEYSGENPPLVWKDIKLFEDAFGRAREEQFTKSRLGVGNIEAMREIYSSSNPIFIDDEIYEIGVTAFGNDPAITFNNGSDFYGLVFWNDPAEELGLKFLLIREKDGRWIQTLTYRDELNMGEKEFKKALLYKAVLEFLMGQCT